MATMKTPGVYIVEKNAFPSSVVEIATAVPAFVGYTEKAGTQRSSLSNKPWRITSMAEFHQYFGFGPTADFVRFSLEKIDPSAAVAVPTAPLEPLARRDSVPLTVNKVGYRLVQQEGFYLLYYSMLHFYQNGGGPCYIVSVGEYESASGKNINSQALRNGIASLEKEQEATMVVIPEAVLLSKAECASVQQAALKHCGETMKNRIALLDIWEGYAARTDSPEDCVDEFRNGLGINHLAFASAYYPWLNTTIVSQQDLSYLNIDESSRETLLACLRDELEALGLSAQKLADQLAEVAKIKTLLKPDEAKLLDKTLLEVSPFFGSIMLQMRTRLNVLPPGPAMAGVYTMVDSSRGVWKAPANVSLNSVVSPTVSISHEQQEDLNVTAQGKSINAIRDFIGEGTLVWGARTLDGNSLDWRYINVRRTMIMLEESIRLASKGYVFEPNDVSTWVTVRSMIDNFLTSIWKRGGLAGAVPDDAFSVRVGLGETMTPEDILEGVMRVSALVAISRPAEFIEITFQQQMQKS